MSEEKQEKRVKIVCAVQQSRSKKNLISVMSRYIVFDEEGKYSHQTDAVQEDIEITAVAG
jgi:hypothetical protein